MSQIPTFLRSLATLIRSLVEQGRAVHVTAKTADELDLLAGLPWEECPATCADIALGWLRLSSARLGPESGYYFANKVDALRAAECAELCALASSWSNWSAAVNEATKTETLTYHTAKPHDGTIEGGRAAWEFMHKNLDRLAGIGDVISSGRGFRVVADTYRRELKAMK